MNKKIKSITIKKDFPNNCFGKVGDTIKWEDCKYMYSVTEPASEDNTVEIIKQFPDFFEIEYEKPTLLKRPDGSLISEPEHYTQICHLILDCNKYAINDTIHYVNGLTPNSTFYAIKQGLIFLAKDKHLAEKKAQMLTKHLEIQYEIDRLNAEEGWVADWNVAGDKWMLSYDTYTNTVTAVTWNQYKLSL